MVKRLFVLDGHSLIYRACYSPAPLLRSAKGEPTKGPYIFLKILQRMVREWSPIDHLVVALDSPRETLRKRLIDPNYKFKGGSTGPDEDTRIQFRFSLDILRELGIPTIAVRGWEADDILATLVRRYGWHQRETYIVTSDKDLHQLVRSDTYCLDVFANKMWDPEEVEVKWGVPPDKVVEVQTLAGDPVDGVPGVKGLGPQRASELVQRFGSAQGVLNNLRKLASGDCGSRRGLKALQTVKSKDLARMRSLVALDSRVPLPVHKLEELAFNGLDLDRARPLFDYLGFKQWKPSSPPTNRVPGLTTSSAHA